MSYVNEILARVAAQNPGQPEFLQAVTEVLESLRVVIEKNEDFSYREMFNRQHFYCRENQNRLWRKVFGSHR